MIFSSMLADSENPIFLVATSILLMVLFTGTLVIIEIQHRRKKKREEERERQTVKKYPPIE